MGGVFGLSAEAKLFVRSARAKKNADDKLMSICSKVASPCIREAPESAMEEIFTWKIKRLWAKASLLEGTNQAEHV